MEQSGGAALVKGGGGLVSLVFLAQDIFVNNEGAIVISIITVFVYTSVQFYHS